MKESINAVIVTYNNRELLRRCVESVIEALSEVPLSATITVIDNNSADGTDRMVKKIFRSVNYIRNSDNVGLSKALNIGISERLDSDYTLLLNDDVELFRDSVRNLLETINSFGGVQGVPAALLHPDGSPQWMKLKLIGTQKEHPKSTRYIRFAGTTACLYRTALFRDYGGFDEFFFFYNEDLDFSLRMKRQGVRFIFNPKARAIHHQAQSRHKAQKAIRPYFYSTDYYFYRKNYGPLFSSVYLLMAWLHIFIWKRRFNKSGDRQKLELLEEGKSKMREAIRDFREIVHQAPSNPGKTKVESI